MFYDHFSARSLLAKLGRVSRYVISSLQYELFRSRNLDTAIFTKESYRYLRYCDKETLNSNQGELHVHWSLCSFEGHHLTNVYHAWGNWTAPCRWRVPSQCLQTSNSHFVELIKCGWHTSCKGYHCLCKENSSCIVPCWGFYPSTLFRSKLYSSCYASYSG